MGGKVGIYPSKTRQEELGAMGRPGSLSMTASFMSEPPVPSYQRPSKRTLRRHEEVDALQYVQEKLVAPILDALAAPADLPRHLAGDLRLLLLCLGQSEEKVLIKNNGRRLIKEPKHARRGAAGRCFLRLRLHYLVLVSGGPG